MVRRLACLLLICSSFATACFAGSENDSSSILGLVEVSSPRNDSIFVRFDMAYYGPMPDSIGMVVYNWGWKTSASASYLEHYGANDTLIMYRFSDSLPLSAGWYDFTFSNRLRFKGNFGISWRFEPSDLSLGFIGFVGEEASKWACFLTTLDRFGGGLFMNAWVPNFGVYKSDLGGALSRKGLLVAYTIGFDMGSPKTQWTLLTSWSGLGKNFAFSAPLQLRAMYYPLERYRWSPFGLVGVNLSKIKVRQEEQEFRKVQFGGEIGGGVTDGLDRLTYTYSTASGGYHTAELFVAAEAYQYSMRIGTYYLFRKTDGLWMFEAGFRIEGMPPDNAVRGRDMKNRPSLAKALGYAGLLPYLPLYAIFRVFEPNRR